MIKNDPCFTCRYVACDVNKYPCNICTGNHAARTENKQYDMYEFDDGFLIVKDAPNECVVSPKTDTDLGGAVADDMVNHPGHYTAGAVECIDAIDSMLKGYADPGCAYYAGQVLKYLWRAPLKGNMLQDLQKADWYLDRMKENIGDEQQTS